MKTNPQLSKESTRKSKYKGNDSGKKASYHQNELSEHLFINEVCVPVYVGLNVCDYVLCSIYIGDTGET